MLSKFQLYDIQYIKSYSIEDVAFNSQTDGGHLKYSMPSIMDIHGLPYEAFNPIALEVIYDVSLWDYDDGTQQVRTLSCDQYPMNCKVHYNRLYTPILYFVSPQVTFGGSQIAFTLDPRWAQNLRSQTLPEMPFLEVRLNGYGVNFDGYADEFTAYPGFTKTQQQGLMGDILPNASASVDFLWRAGYSLKLAQTNLRCSYDNQTCYEVKAVARVDSISAT